MNIEGCIDRIRLTSLCQVQLKYLNLVIHPYGLVNFMRFRFVQMCPQHNVSTLQCVMLLSEGNSQITYPAILVLRWKHAQFCGLYAKLIYLMH